MQITELITTAHTPPSMSTTETQYLQAVASCRDLFLKKSQDYGASWRVYRTISIADQIYIKARRIRTIQEKRQQRVGDDIQSEFRGILNYAVIGLIQMELGEGDPEATDLSRLPVLYDACIEKARTLMGEKNHDYGEAWREMSQESFVDLILSKLLRIRQIVANEGRTRVSEGIDANLFDILNYAAFALILIGEGKHSNQYH